MRHADLSDKEGGQSERARAYVRSFVVSWCSKDRTQRRATLMRNKNVTRHVMRDSSGPFEILAEEIGLSKPHPDQI